MNIAENKQWPEIWNAAFRILEDGVVSNCAWLQPLVWVNTEELSEKGVFRVELEAPNDFSANWVRNNLRKKVEDVISQVSGVNCELYVSVKGIANTSNTSSETKEQKTEDKESADKTILNNTDNIWDSNGPENPLPPFATKTSKETKKHTMNRNTNSHFNNISNQFKTNSLNNTQGNIPGNIKDNIPRNSHHDRNSDDLPERPLHYSDEIITTSDVSDFSERTYAGNSSDENKAEPLPPYGNGTGNDTGRANSRQNRSQQENHLDVHNYTFDSFVVGASNQFAHASAVAVAENPGKQYNPLFLYSPPGLGKTHLLHAIRNQVILRNPNTRVAYLSAERFVNELVYCLQHKRMPHFRAKYRDSYDMILIDDIQFIAQKGASEEEFFHTFNVLHASKRQIVVSSDRPPKDIEGLEERVRTRFEWGLIADISPPEIETRIAILKIKAERDDIYLPDDVATFLASYIKNNVRELEGMLVRLQAHASLSGAEISLEMAKHELRNSVAEEGAEFTIESILGAVAKHFHLKPQEIKATSRARNVAMPRQIAMYLIRKYTGIGLKEIGHYFGGKDHTTILYGCREIEKKVESDEEIRNSVEAIQNLL